MQVPPVASDIEEHCEASVRFITWWCDEPHARGDQPCVRCVEVLDPQEEPDAAGRLIADDRALVFAISAGEKDAGLRAGRPDNNPPLRTAVIGQRW